MSTTNRKRIVGALEISAHLNANRHRWWPTQSGSSSAECLFDIFVVVAVVVVVVVVVVVWWSSLSLGPNWSAIVNWLVKVRLRSPLD